MRPDFTSPVVLSGLSAYPGPSKNGLVQAHQGVAELFEKLGLDPSNPFSEWIKPGMRVLVKPNWVRHAAEGWSEMESLITHPSILRPVIEAIACALRTSDGSYHGQICIADAPLQSANFELLLSQSSIPALLLHWQSLGMPVILRDLRRVVAETDDSTGIVQLTRSAAGDPTGDTIVDLGTRSRLEPLLSGHEGFGVSNYDSAITSTHHNPGIHRYRIANSLLNADVVVNLPKLKTHVKTGITGAMKNFIGVNCDKSFLPHYRLGSPRNGGDEYPDSMTGAWIARLRPIVEKVMPGGWIRTARKSLLGANLRSSKPLIFGGAWSGNDTLWRTIHDIVFIARWMGSGSIQLSSPRTILTLMDAVVAGQGDGPLRPDPAHMGCLLFGTDLGCVDVTAASLAGFDWKSIPMLAHLKDAEAASITSFDSESVLPSTMLHLAPPTAWAEILSTKEDTYVAA